MSFLETERLLFRSHEASDEEDFIKMQTDAETRCYVGGRAWSRDEAIRRFRDQYLGKPLDTSNLCATELKTERRYIGFCGLRLDNSQAKSAHLGYYIARPFWGRGLATEASKAFIELAFSSLGLDELHAAVQRGHAASEHILNKFGFSLSDEEKLPGGRVISNYCLSRDRWKLA